MRLSFKLLGALSLGLALAGSALSIGCAAEPSGDDADSTSADITGSLGNARACAVEKAYLAADVSDFTIVKKTDIPFPLPITPEAEYFATFASFQAAGVGTIYYAEAPVFFDGGSASTIYGYFYDASGKMLLVSSNDGDTSSFYSASTSPLACGGTPGHADAGTKDSSVVHPPHADGGSEASAPHPHPVSEAGAHDAGAFDQ